MHFVFLPDVLAVLWRSFRSLLTLTFSALPLLHAGTRPGTDMSGQHLKAAVLGLREGWKIRLCLSWQLAYISGCASFFWAAIFCVGSDLSVCGPCSPLIHFTAPCLCRCGPSTIPCDSSFQTLAALCVKNRFLSSKRWIFFMAHQVPPCSHSAGTN